MVRASGIGAIVLAAGGSSRLGRPKQFVVHDGLSLVGRDAEGVCFWTRHLTRLPRCVPGLRSLD